MSAISSLRDITFEQELALRQRKGKILEILALLSILLGIAILLTLLVDVFLDGYPWLSTRLFTEFPSRFPEKPGCGLHFKDQYG